MPPCSSLLELEAQFENEDGITFMSFGFLRQTNFYQGAVGGNLVFANLELIGALPERFDIYVDGTFNVTPFHARQLLVILAELHGRPRPIIYAVMPGRTAEDYEETFAFIRDGILSYDGMQRTPVAATSDFEQGLRLALLQVWPQIECFVCEFHFCQCLRRKELKTNSLSQHMTGATIIHRVVLMFMRLSFLPLHRITTRLLIL